MSLRDRLVDWNERRLEFLDELAALDPRCLEAHPIVGKWSILEIVEHLVLGERVVYLNLTEPSRLVERPRGLVTRGRYLLVLGLLKSRLRVRIPAREMAPRGGRTLSELRGLWDENQAWLLSVVELLGPAGVRRAVLAHPAVGPLTVEQAFEMGCIHFERHVRQIRDIKRRLALDG